MKVASQEPNAAVLNMEHASLDAAPFDQPCLLIDHWLHDSASWLEVSFFDQPGNPEAIIDEQSGPLAAITARSREPARKIYNLHKLNRLQLVISHPDPAVLRQLYSRCWEKHIQQQILALLPLQPALRAPRASVPFALEPEPYDPFEI